MEPNHLPSSENLTFVVGKNLKRFRLQRGLSLERLADVSGVSRAMLSQIERGQSAPNINTLDKIAKAVGINFAKFVHRSTVPLISIFKNEDKQPSIQSADNKSSLHHIIPQNTSYDNRVGFYEIRLLPSGKHSFNAHLQGALQRLFVFQGSVELNVDGQLHRLAKGDAALFQADVPHSFINLGKTEAILYVVLTQGE